MAPYTQRVANLLNTVDENGVNNPEDRVVVSGNMLPSTCNLFNLGSSNFRWKDLYLSGNTIDLGGVRISRTEQGGLEIKNTSGSNANQNVATLTTSNIVIISGGNLNIGGTLLSHSTQGLDIRNSNGDLASQTVSNIIASNVFVSTGGYLDIGGTRLTHSTQGLDIRDASGFLMSQTVSNITASNVLVSTGGYVDIGGTRLSHTTQGLDIRDASGFLMSQTVSNITASNVIVSTNGYVDIGGTRLSRSTQGLDIRDDSGYLISHTVSNITASNVFVSTGGYVDIGGTRLSRSTQGLDIRDASGFLMSQTVSNITASNVLVSTSGYVDIGGTRLMHSTQGFDIRDSNGFLASQTVSNVSASNLYITGTGLIDCASLSNVLSIGLQASQLNIGTGSVKKTINIGGSLDTVLVQGASLAATPVIWFNTSYGAVADFTKTSVYDGWSDAYTTQSSHNAFNAATGIFTAPVTGLYSYSFSVRSGSYVWVYVNNSGVRQIYMNYGSDIIKLNANDQMKLVTSGTVTVSSGFWWQRTWFTAVLVQKV